MGFCKYSEKKQGRQAKLSTLLNLYLGDIEEESDFNSNSPKMAIKTLGQALQIKVECVSRNTGIL